MLLVPPLVVPREQNWDFSSRSHVSLTASLTTVPRETSHGRLFSPDGLEDHVMTVDLLPRTRQEFTTDGKCFVSHFLLLVTCPTAEGRVMRKLG